MSRLETGQVIGGRYRIQDFVGEGGMQEVHTANDTVLNRTLALKTPLSSSASRRFGHSARLSAKVSHDAVARTFDLVTEGERQYLLEEYVDGLDLGKMLREVQRLDAPAVARVFHTMARGLAALHEQGVIHRDLKPSNVMIQGGWRFEKIKITDFGVSNMTDEEIRRGVAGGPLGLTGSRTLIGHLPYMAPEVLKQKNLKGFPSDIWSLGALAYHLLTGRPPFGVSLNDVVLGLNSKEGPPELEPEVRLHPQLGPLSRELEGLIRTCLQRKPDARPTARDLARQCEQLCYSKASRALGTVTQVKHGVYAFAQLDPSAQASSSFGQETIFFHQQSVCGPMPRAGSQVWLAPHAGTPNPRAHPVVPLAHWQTFEEMPNPFGLLDDDDF